LDPSLLFSAPEKVAPRLSHAGAGLNTRIARTEAKLAKADNPKGIMAMANTIAPMTIKGGTDKPTPKLNQTALPFRERLGCSPNEACVALGVGRTFLYKLIAEHRIQVSKVGRRTIVSVPSLLKLLGGVS
jgi:excisionase family DNA binding protein